MSLQDFYCSRFFLGAVRANCQTLNGVPLKGKTLTGNDRIPGVGVGPLEMECQEVKQLECDAKLAEKVDEAGERIGEKVDAAKDEIKDEIHELSRHVHELAERRGRGGRRRHPAAQSTPPKASNATTAGSSSTPSATDGYKKGSRSHRTFQ